MVLGSRPAASPCSQNDLPSVEGLCISVRSIRLHAAKPEDAQEEILREPPPIPLGLEVREEVLDLPLGKPIVEMDEDVGGTQVAVVLGNLVLEDEMVAKRVPGELRCESVILVPIVAVVREDQIGGDDRFQVLEELLDVSSAVRKETVSEVPDDDLLPLAPVEKGLGACVHLVCPLAVSAQDDPADLDAWMGRDQPKDRPAAVT